MKLLRLSLDADPGSRADAWGWLLIAALLTGTCGADIGYVSTWVAFDF